MATNKVLLDVDSSIIENNLLINTDAPTRLPSSRNEDLEQLFPRSAEEPSKIIQLTPALCLKTRDMSGNKVFVNLCTAEDLPVPPEVSDSELALILDSDDTTKYRVPMCLGEAHNEPDKSGKICKVYDVAVNPLTLKRFDASELFRQFIISASLEGIHEKYKVDLNMQEVTILAKRKSMGTPRAQRIRAGTGKTSIPLISEICPAQALDLRPRRKVPKYRILGEQSDLGKVSCMNAEVTLPDVTTPDELEVDVGEDRLVVKGQRTGYKLDVYLPHLVHQDRVTALFDRDTRVLQVSMPVSG
jgi:hypothetical protein